MNKNLGNADRIIRVFAAIIIAALIGTGALTGVSGWVLGIFAVVFVLTSFVGLCPLYLAFGISTAKSKSAERGEKNAMEQQRV